MNSECCQKCVLPNNFPGIAFDVEGICNYCLDYEEKKIDFNAVRQDAEATVRSLLRQNASYDIALAFSGGKDSTYTLKYLRDNFNAKIIAITIDNGFISDVARQNCLTVTSHIGVDHIMFRPNPRAMTNIYNVSLKKEIYPISALKRATSVCNSCIQVINTQLLNFASNYKIPIVAGGYLGGQIPSEKGLMKQKLSASIKTRSILNKNLEGKFSQDALQLFSYTTNNFQSEIYVINPMAYLNISEKNILEAIAPLGWVRPTDTGGASTNCLLNDYAIHDHIKKFNFHPYILEIATMVRRGTISRADGLAKLSEQINTAHFKDIEKRLDYSYENSSNSWTR